MIETGILAKHWHFGQTRNIARKIKLKSWPHILQLNSELYTQIDIVVYL